MSDPQRLRDGEGAPKVAHLLAAVPRPRSLPPEVRARSLARVQSLAGGSAAVGAGAGLKALLAVTLIAGAAVAAAIYGGGGAPAVANAVPSVTASPSAMAQPIVDEAPSADPPPPSAIAETHVVAPPTAIPPAITTDRAPAPRASAVDPLTDESMRLGEANAMLAHDPAKALAAVDAYDAAYPNGQMRDEAEYIAVEALLALGRTPAARARANALVVRSPKSVFARLAEEKMRDAE